MDSILCMMSFGVFISPKVSTLAVGHVHRVGNAPGSIEITSGRGENGGF
jgi:hypothetical protein